MQDCAIYIQYSNNSWWINCVAKKNKMTPKLLEKRNGSVFTVNASNYGRISRIALYRDYLSSD